MKRLLSSWLARWRNRAKNYPSGEPKSYGILWMLLLIAALAGLFCLSFVANGYGGELYSFVAVVLWGCIGLFLVLIFPIVLFYDDERGKMFVSIVAGIVYFLLSFLVAALF